MLNEKLNIKIILLYIIHFTLYIFVVGCSVKTTPVYAVIKTPKFKAADQGFLEEGFGYKKLTIYKAANAPVEIILKNSTVCINGKCMDKEKFVREFLPKGYPADVFDKILSRKCIKGFYCKTTGKKIIFKDKKNDILIIIKDLD